MLILIASVWLGCTYLKWVTTNFVVTTDRLIYRHGVLSKHGIEIPLERVNTVFFSPVDPRAHGRAPATS